MSLQENIRYVREKRVAALLNEMVLHILARNPDDPLDDLILFLEKQLPADQRKPKQVKQASVSEKKSDGEQPPKQAPLPQRHSSPSHEPRVVGADTVHARSDPVKATHSLGTLNEVEARHLVARMLVNESLLQAETIANGRTRTKQTELLSAWERLDKSIPAVVPVKESPLQVFTAAEELMRAEIQFRSKLLEHQGHQVQPVDEWTRGCLERATQISDKKIGLLAQLEHQNTVVLHRSCKGSLRKILESSVSEHTASVKLLCSPAKHGHAESAVGPTPTLDSITERFLHNEHAFRLVLSDLKAKTPAASQSRVAIDTALKNSRSVGDAVQEVALGCWYLQRAPSKEAAADLLAETKSKLQAVENEVMKAHLRLDRTRKLFEAESHGSLKLPSEALRTIEGKRALGLSKNIEGVLQVVEKNQQKLSRLCPP
eukprot:TRINITY_DN93692_c0_g1_i1.p1 TRINITY_DN93692_c0_g1~~TRINITY_DN93692_c0_g1_i1.p1  ORF type:complete len:442 (-),score=61.69 TRINITY_DN93692_c0_g1_i1:34-1323(-)